MGACLGHCYNFISDCFSNRSYLRHTNAFIDEDEQNEFGYSINTAIEQHINHSNSPKKFLSLFYLKKFKQRCTVPVTLELIEDTGWAGQHNRYKRLSKNASTSSGLDNPLQMLDASGLLMRQGCVSLTPTSSIDLEWENDGMPTLVVENNRIQNLDESLSEPTGNNSQPSSLTASPWSQVSTPNSLEWDPVEADNLDFETDKLLSEIERLTNKALEETAEWTNSS